LDLTIGGSGFIGGARLAKLMEKYFGHMNIEDLGGRFIVVTTELATAHEIWLREGSLVQAIRASYALPGVFAPIKINNRWLIDGGLVNPVPVSVCRAFGARLVIAVNLHADVYGKINLVEGQRLEQEDNNSIPTTLAETIKTSPQRILMKQLFGTGKKAPGVGTVMLGALNIVMDRLGRSRMAGDPPDVLVAPRVGHISLLDFDRARETIELGRQAFKQALPQIEEAMAILS